MLNPTHLIFVYLIRFVEFARIMHQGLFLFRNFILYRITQGLAVKNLDYPDNVLLHSHKGARVWVASAAYCSRGRCLPARRNDMMGRSPAAHPRKHLGRGVVDGPQTIAVKTRGEREGYNYCLLSLGLLIPYQSFCLPPYYTADASC